MFICFDMLYMHNAVVWTKSRLECRSKLATERNKKHQTYRNFSKWNSMSIYLLLIFPHKLVNFKIYTKVLPYVKSVSIQPNIFRLNWNVKR